MELILLGLSILTIAVMIGISMVSFMIAIKALQKVILLEEKYPLQTKKNK